MRQFYQMFKIRDTLRPELTWSHYRRLISVENEQARIWYMNEAADSVWSTRQMDRQISTLYYERLLACKDNWNAMLQIHHPGRRYFHIRFMYIYIHLYTKFD